MKVGDRVMTPLGFTGTITGFFETTYQGAHIRFDEPQIANPDHYCPETGPYPLSLLTPILEENNHDEH